MSELQQESVKQESVENSKQESNVDVSHKESTEGSKQESNVMKSEKDEEEQAVFDIMNNGKKTGIAFNVNPVVVTSDDECCTLLTKFMQDHPDLSTDEKQLLTNCIGVTKASDDDDVSFGPAEILFLSQLAQTYPEHANDLVACSHFLTNNVDCEGELPPGLFLGLADAHGELSNMLTEALKMGDNIPELEDDVDDEDFEEPIDNDE